MLFSGRGESGWRLSVLGGPDVAADLARVDRFNRLFAPAAKVDTLEVKAEEAQQIHLVMTLLPASITAFFEIPGVSAGTGALPTLATLGARAKVRTGALTPQGIPPAGDLARFIRGCADAGVPVKATAAGGETWERTLAVDVPEDQFFMVGIGDVTVGQNHVSGHVEPLSPDDRSDGDVFADGRIAFHLKGKVS